jgi:hypothetical protein
MMDPGMKDPETTDQDREDRRLEAYLRSFQPRQPRPLPGRSRLLVLSWRAPAIAVAAVAAVLTFALLFMRHTSGPVPSPTVRVETPSTRDNNIGEQISLGRLSALANQAPARLDAHLDQVSPKLLPDVLSGHGILKTLSAE